MNAGLQAVALARLENLLRFVGREDACFAEDVTPLGKAVARRGRDHLAHELVDVEAAVRAVLDRDLVRAHERRDQLDLVLGVQPADGAQHFQLGIGLEAVPALGLARRRAAAQHLVEARPGGRHQFVLGGLARGADGGEDAAPFGGDLGIGRACEPAPEFLAAIPGEDDVCVRIDEAGHDRAAGGVDDGRAGVGRAEAIGIVGRPDKLDHPVGGDNRGVANGARVSLRRAALRRASGAGEHHPGVADDRAGRHDRAGVSRVAR